MIATIAPPIVNLTGKNKIEVTLNKKKSSAKSIQNNKNPAHLLAKQQSLTGNEANQQTSKPTHKTRIPKRNTRIIR